MRDYGNLHFPWDATRYPKETGKRGARSCVRAWPSRGTHGHPGIPTKTPIPCKKRHTAPCCPLLPMQTYIENNGGRISGGPRAPRSNYRNHTATWAMGANDYGNLHFPWDSSGPTPRNARELPMDNNHIDRVTHTCIHLPSSPEHKHTNKPHKKILQGCQVPHCPLTNIRRGPSTHLNPKQPRGLPETITRGSGAEDGRRPIKKGRHMAHATKTTQTEPPSQPRPKRRTPTERPTNTTICKTHNGGASGPPASTRTKTYDAYKVEPDMKTNSHRDYKIEPHHNRARMRGHIGETRRLGPYQQHSPHKSPSHHPHCTHDTNLPKLPHTTQHPNTKSITIAQTSCPSPRT